MHPELFDLISKDADRRLMELARYTYDQASGLTAREYGPLFMKQREAYNAHIHAAQDILRAIARESDLFLCRSCEEHFTSHDGSPTCPRCKTYKIVNVPEETIYCGCCNRGADWVDESGDCAECAEEHRKAYPHGVGGSLPYGA